MKEQDLPDSSTEIMDFTELLSGLSGQWVVLSEDKKRVLYSATKLSDLFGKMDEGVVMMVPSSGAVYMPAFI